MVLRLKARRDTLEMKQHCDGLFSPELPSPFVWTLWRREKSLAPAGNRTMIPRSSSPWPIRNTDKKKNRAFYKYFKYVTKEYHLLGYDAV
jgi:hypothetical protein